MITRIKIDGFKSFQNFEMEFAPFTVIAGANASGKSNLFDALKLLSDLANDELKTAFGKQRGNASELFTQYSPVEYATEMSFEVDLLLDNSELSAVEDLPNQSRVRYTLKIGRAFDERNFSRLIILHEQLSTISEIEDNWAKVYIDNDDLAVLVGHRSNVSTDIIIATSTYATAEQGAADNYYPISKYRLKSANILTRTLLSTMSFGDKHVPVEARKEFGLWGFIALNYEDLRAPSSTDVTTFYLIKPSGENLAAALYKLDSDNPYALKDIARRVGSIIPSVTSISVNRDDVGGYFHFSITMTDGNKYSARVLSEGTLRILALCALEYERVSGFSVMAYEEPENGLHPASVKALIPVLRDTATNFDEPTPPLRQVLITTHSPVFVGEVLENTTKRQAMVYFSHLNSLSTQINGKKNTLKITRFDEVVKDKASSDLSKVDRYTLAEVKKYLHSADYQIETTSH